MSELTQKAKECVLNQLQLIEDAGKITKAQIEKGQCPAEAIAKLSEATGNLLQTIGMYGMPD